MTLEPDLEAFTFKGTVDIEFQVNSASKEIILHAKELCFESAEYIVLDKDNQNATTTPPVKAEQMIVNLKETTVKFVFPQAFESTGNSNIKLTIHYIGFLNDQMAGFYRSTYQDIKGNTKIMASTQFEALDARRAFPCVDEPAAKAVFGATLIIPSHLHCMSNMPEASCISLSSSTTTTTGSSSTKKQVKFMDSPKMSTYLLTFVVGEFDYVQAQTEHGVLVKVYTPPGKASSGSFALDCAVRSLDLFDVFFDTHFPLPKVSFFLFWSNRCCVGARKCRHRKLLVVRAQTKH